MGRTAIVLLLAVAVACDHGTPRLVVGDGVPEDVGALAGDVWADFLSAFPAREGCLPDVELGVDRDLPDRGRYLPAEGRVLIRIPWTAPRLAQTLAHELGHHLEHACPEQEDVRTAFLAAIGRPADAGWFDGGSWETTPSELFAEAVSVVVLGDGTRVAVPLDEEAVAVVQVWGAGRVMHAASAP